MHRIKNLIFGNPKSGQNVEKLAEDIFVGKLA